MQIETKFQKKFHLGTLAENALYYSVLFSIILGTPCIRMRLKLTTVTVGDKNVLKKENCLFILLDCELLLTNAN